MQAEFFRVLTVSVDRARRLMNERSKWRLNPHQQDWLRIQNWQTVITELDIVEQPPVPRAPMGPTPPNNAAPPAVAASSQPSSVTSRTSAADGPSSSADQTAPTAPDQSKKGTPCTNTVTSIQEKEPPTPSVSDTPPKLHNANTTTADFVQVKEHVRSPPMKPRSEKTGGSQRESTSGLATATVESKTALEQEGRKFAANELTKMGYAVEQMAPGNPGFDLRAVKPGCVLKVEVKSHAQKASRVFVTQREWEEYLRTRNVPGYAWELWNVEYLASTSRLRPTIQRVGYIPKRALKESGYYVDLGQCTQEAPKSGTPEPQ